MKSILLFVLLAAVHLVAAFHCPPNVTQHLLDSDNQTYRYEVAIQNDSPYVLREIIMLPSSNMTVEGMNVSEAGIRFPFRALPPHKTHHWTYTHDSAEPATFDVVVAECVNHTRHHHGGNHTHSSNDTRPTVAPTANPSNDTVPTASPTADPVSSEAPTEAPNHTHPTHSANPTHRPARPTSNPTSGATSAPTSAPTSGATSAPTTRPTSGATSAPTTRPTSAPTSAPTSGATSAPTSRPTSAPTSGATSAPTTRPTSAPTSSATSAPTAAPTVAATSAPTAPTSAPSNTTTSISGTCSGTPRMLNGKPCASTTRYWDGNLGACGCGDSSGAFSWVASSYTAAASPPLFGTATNCGTGCGKCYQLTATGYSPAGTGATAGQTITVMVTNLCPSGGEWCASGLNSFEYGAHFDLADSPTAQLITKLGWDNPEVVYEEVSCSGTLTPTAADGAQCTCPSS